MKKIGLFFVLTLLVGSLTFMATAGIAESQKSEVHKTFNLHYPQPHMVYQRHLPADGRGDIRIVVDYKGPPSGVIEAQFAGGPWVQISKGLTTGNHVLRLPNQPLGNGDFSIRQVPDNPGSPMAVTVKHVAIGVVIGQLGQSNNKSGYGRKGYPYKNSQHQCAIFGSDEFKDYNRTRWIPCDGSQSYYPLLAQKIADHKGVSVGFLEAAIGGKDPHQWQHDFPFRLEQNEPENDNRPLNETYFRKDLNLYNRFLEMARLTGGVEILNYYDLTDPTISQWQENRLKTKLVRLANQLHADTDRKLMLSKTHQVYLDHGEPYDIVSINRAVQALWESSPNILPGIDPSDLSAAKATGEGDNLHLRSDSNVEALGNKFWEALRLRLGAF